VIALSLVLYLPHFNSLFGLQSEGFRLLEHSGLAFGDEIAEAQSSVDAASSELLSAQARLAEISSECDTLSQDINDLQAQIDEATLKILSAQSEMLEGRQLLGDVAVSEYKSSTVSLALSAVMQAGSLSDILRDFRYANNVMEYYSSEIAHQKELREAFVELSEELNQQKNAQEEKWAQLQQNLTEASDLVAQASTNLQLSEAQLNSLVEQQAKIQSQATEAAESAALLAPSTTDVAADNADSDASQEQTGSTDVSTSTNNQNNSSSTTQPSTPSAPSVSESSTVQWLSGIASAYGGSSDPSTPNPGITATGAVCNDSSMGVAVPMSLANYRSYFGRTVEICYNGMTVYAVVNDCGYMSGGARALDLQPGVFKAFGYSTCQAWGLRNVTYRFL
jgi:peptidoglycan hydrolase CwlO-like protein